MHEQESPHRRGWLSRVVGTVGTVVRVLTVIVVLLALLGAAFVGGAVWLYSAGLAQIQYLPPVIRSALPPPVSANWNPSTGAGPATVPDGPIIAPDQQVTVSSSRTGAIEALAVTVTSGGEVIGPVTGHQQVEVHGTVSGNVQAPVVTVGRERSSRAASVHGAVSGQAVTVHASSGVTGGVIATEVVQVAGNVTGDIRAPRVVLQASAVVTGDILVTEGRLVMAPGAVVNGRLQGTEAGIVLQSPAGTTRSVQRADDPFGNVAVRTPYRETVYVNRGNSGLGVAAAAGLLGVLGLIALVALGRVFLPAAVDEATTVIEGRPWRSLVLGIWTALLAALVAAVLGITIIGIPLAAAVALGVAAAIVLGITAVSDVTGARLLTALGRSGDAPLTRIAVGAAGLGLLLFVPILGWLILTGAILAGFGASAGIWYPRLGPAWRQWREARRKGEQTN